GRDRQGAPADGRPAVLALIGWSPGALQPLTLAGMPVFEWVHELWDRVGGTQPVLPAWGIVVSGAVAVLIVGNPRTWRLARNPVTIAHEGGHALASVLSGRRLDGIRLHSDTSGVTYSRGRRTGPAVVLTSAAGYPTPSMLGAGAAWLLAAHHVTAVLWLLLALLAATFLAIRNTYGVLAVLVTVGVVLTVSWFATPATQAAFGCTAAWVLLLGGVRAVAELQSRRRSSRRRGQASTSDADQLARLTGVPGGVWVAVFALVCLTALVLGARMLIPSLPHLAG
ncbi:MAG TPA: M50 family metallopeptidase, partial [Streptosporangiaceae bacterium]|nr:M50 family metallopeptidase [Streptosporangiaceae bacterium]